MLFQVSLEHEMVVESRQMRRVKTSTYYQESGGEDELVESAVHQLVGNQSPVSQFHSILLLYPEECLPQVMNSQMLRLVY